MDDRNTQPGLLVQVRDVQRIASSTAIRDMRPGSNAAITEYSQPGIVYAYPLPRPRTYRTGALGPSPRPGCAARWRLG